jgi:hypothetical protein
LDALLSKSWGAPETPPEFIHGETRRVRRKAEIRRVAPFISKGLLSDKGIPIVLDFSPHSFYDRKELMVYFFQ